MAWFKKKPDPISDRARALNDEIAALESRIKTLDAQVQRRQAQPRLRSTALPQGATLSHAPPKTGPPVQEPIFEEVEQHRLHPQADTPSTPEHYNDLGMRKYDLPALLRRIGANFAVPRPLIQSWSATWRRAEFTGCVRCGMRSASPGDVSSSLPPFSFWRYGA